MLSRLIRFLHIFLQYKTIDERIESKYEEKRSSQLNVWVLVLVDSRREEILPLHLVFSVLCSSFSVLCSLSSLFFVSSHYLNILLGSLSKKIYIYPSWVSLWLDHVATEIGVKRTFKNDEWWMMMTALITWTGPLCPDHIVARGQAIAIGQGQKKKKKR